jgi:hypothetical protein
LTSRLDSCRYIAQVTGILVRTDLDVGCIIFSQNLGSFDGYFIFKWISVSHKHRKNQSKVEGQCKITWDATRATRGIRRWCKEDSLNSERRGSLIHMQAYFIILSDPESSRLQE